MNRRNRAVAYVLFGAMVGSHFVEQGGASPIAWSVLALYGMLVPQLAYWSAAHAEQPMRAELCWLFGDGFTFAIWGGALGLPLWITYVLLAGVVMNLAAFRGVRGAVEVVALFAASAVLGFGAFGAGFRPETGPWTTGIAMATLLWYLLVFALDAHRRTLRLQQVKADLQAKEGSLRDVNTRQQQQLVEIGRLRDELTVQAQRDALTGLFNRHYLMPTLERERARAVRSAQPLCVWMLDLDHFKRINDGYGHLVGDRVLTRFAALLQSLARAEDVPCRFGGEEFVLLAPGMSAEIARERAEALRQAVEAVRDWDPAHPALRCTVSIGVAVLDPHANLPTERLLERGTNTAHEGK